nr:MAG TPA: hypothetical protein [Caudoviricetes sp.]
MSGSNVLIIFDKTAEHSENRLWMMANMGRIL